MKNEKNKVLQIVQNISKHVDAKKWECLFPECNNSSINSHLLQVNGILNNIVENGHLYEIGANDIFSFEEKGITTFNKKGINQAISDHLFCNTHDTQIFKDIESASIDLFKYKTQLLFSYRSLCGELRKKMKNVDFFERLINVKAVPIENFYDLESLKKEIIGNKIGVEHMTIYKTNMELEIFSNSIPKFKFYTYQFPEMKICVSAIFSPIHMTDIILSKQLYPENPLKNVFINVIPHESKLTIIIGYHVDFADDWIRNYVALWGEIEGVELQKQLTNLLTTKVETWSISPSLFEKITESSKQKLKKYWQENANNLLADQIVNFNLFEGTT